MARPLASRRIFRDRPRPGLSGSPRQMRRARLRAGQTDRPVSCIRFCGLELEIVAAEFDGQSAPVPDLKACPAILGSGERNSNFEKSCRTRLIARNRHRIPVPVRRELRIRRPSASPLLRLTGQIQFDSFRRGVHLRRYRYGHGAIRRNKPPVLYGARRASSLWRGMGNLDLMPMGRCSVAGSDSSGAGSVGDAEGPQVRAFRMRCVAMLLLAQSPVTGGTSLSVGAERSEMGQTRKEIRHAETERC